MPSTISRRSLPTTTKPRSPYSGKSFGNRGGLGPPAPFPGMTAPCAPSGPSYRGRDECTSGNAIHSRGHDPEDSPSGMVSRRHGGGGVRHLETGEAVERRPPRRQDPLHLGRMLLEGWVAQVPRTLGLTGGLGRG